MGMSSTNTAMHAARRVECTVDSMTNVERVADVAARMIAREFFPAPASLPPPLVTSLKPMAYARQTEPYKKSTLLI